VTSHAAEVQGRTIGANIDGAPNWTFRCPRHLEHDPGCGGDCETRHL